MRTKPTHRLALHPWGVTLPCVFTEQGVAMLSSVLHSSRAVEVNIATMRTFVQLRRLMDSNAVLAEKIEALEAKYAEHDQHFEVVFEAIKQLISTPTSPTREIGFHTRWLHERKSNLRPPSRPSPVIDCLYGSVHAVGVKCDNCAGKLDGMMTFCPYCGVRQSIDLRQINFRDIDTREPMPCPSCKTYLSAIEITTDGKPVRIERCESCQGLFFNPGELEHLLDMQSHEIVWLDVQQLGAVADTFSNNGDIVYRKCPLCTERMSPHNFGGKSGVILDRCGTHGFWLDGGEFRKLAEWWRAGGRLIYQNNEAERTHWLHERKRSPQASAGSVDSGPMPVGPVDPTCIPDIAGTVFDVILGGLGDILLP